MPGPRICVGSGMGRRRESSSTEQPPSIRAAARMGKVKHLNFILRYGIRLLKFNLFLLKILKIWKIFLKVQKKG